MAFGHHEGGDWVGVPILKQIGQQGHNVREVLGEEGQHLVVGIQLIQAIGAFKRAKQGASEGLVWVGQRHQHEVASWPNVQTVRLHLEVAIGAGKHGDFLVAMGKVALLKIKAVVAHHLATDGAECAVGSKHAVGLEFHVMALVIKEHCHARFVGLVPFASVPPQELHVVKRFRLLDQDAVQACSGHRVNALALQSVGLECSRSIHRVHASAPDGQGDFPNPVRHATDLQRLPSTVTQGKVDASATLKRSHPRVRTSLDDGHLVPSIGEHSGKQAANQSCTDHRHLIHARGSGLGSSRRSSR